MRRGELRLGNVQGDHGKRRPVLVAQSNSLNETHATILICLLSSDIQDGVVKGKPNTVFGAH